MDKLVEFKRLKKFLDNVSYQTKVEAEFSIPSESSFDEDYIVGLSLDKKTAITIIQERIEVLRKEIQKELDS